LRDRDSMKQERVKIGDLVPLLLEKVRWIPLYHDPPLRPRSRTRPRLADSIPRTRTSSRTIQLWSQCMRKSRGGSKRQWQKAT